MTSKDKLNLFPSRANYVFVKQRMVSAQKGLELLKRKRDALELKLREYKAQLNSQQGTADETVRAAIFSMSRLEYLGTDLKPHGMLNVANPDVYLRFSFMKTIGVIVPQFEVSLQKARSYPLTGLSRGGTELPKVRQKFQDALKQLTKLASIDYAVKVLDKGVHQNNMRINGLEFVVLPRYQNTLSYIIDELDEFEREDFYRLKKGQAKRLKKQQTEIENMRHKLEDPENFVKKVQKERDDKLKNMTNWKKVFTNKMEAENKARYEREQAREAAKRQLEAEEVSEEEFEEEYGEFDFEELEEEDDDNLNAQIVDRSLKLGDSLRSTLKSYAIDDPDTAEGSREVIQSRSVITPPTFLKGSNSFIMSTTQSQQQISKSEEVEPQSGSMVQSRNVSSTPSQQQVSKSEDIELKSGSMVQSRNVSATPSQQQISKSEDIEHQNDLLTQSRQINKSSSEIITKSQQQTPNTNDAEPQSDDERPTSSTPQEKDANKTN